MAHRVWRVIYSVWPCVVWESHMTRCSCQCCMWLKAVLETWVVYIASFCLWKVDYQTEFSVEFFDTYLSVYIGLLLLLITRTAQCIDEWINPQKSPIYGFVHRMSVELYVHCCTWHAMPSERNFYVTFEFSRLWSVTFEQLWMISGCFGSDNVPFCGNLVANWNLWAPVIFPFRNTGWAKKSKPAWSTHNFVKYFLAHPVYSFLSENCNFLPLYFYSLSCHWARVARLMTLQRSLQYSLSLS